MEISTAQTPHLHEDYISRITAWAHHPTPEGILGTHSTNGHTWYQCSFRDVVCLRPFPELPTPNFNRKSVMVASWWKLGELRMIIGATLTASKAREFPGRTKWSVLHIWISEPSNSFITPKSYWPLLHQPNHGPGFPPPNIFFLKGLYPMNLLKVRVIPNKKILYTESVTIRRRDVFSAPFLDNNLTMVNLRLSISSKFSSFFLIFGVPLWFFC